ncbi:MAG: hypothetical protein WD690_12440 [Vicinamibacterales bacterium]
MIAHHRGERLHVPDNQDLGRLFHQLNNQLGIVLANAELLEARATDVATRSRAAQVVSSALDALSTAREIRKLTDSGPSNT